MVDPANPANFQKEEALEALKRLESELSAKLEVEVKSGDIAINRRGNDLVVDVSDKILFDTGKTEIKDQGKQVPKESTHRDRAAPEAE